MSKHTYRQAADFFLTTAARVRPGQWDRPALGVWTVRDLVGHTTRAMMTVEEFAAIVPDRITLHSGAEYYHGAFSGTGTDDQIAVRGKETGQALGDDPMSAVREVYDRVMGLLDSLPDDHPVGSRVGGIALVDYLPSRTTELLVHTLDLASALAIDAEPPPEALAEVLHLLADLSVLNGVGGTFALLATGRPQPGGFSVFPVSATGGPSAAALQHQTGTKQRYEDAVRFFLDTASQVRPDRWGQPALGVWTARELVGHTMRAMTTLQDYAASAPESVTLDSPVAYYQAVVGLAGVHEQVAARGKEAGSSLGDDPVATVRAVANDVSALVASLPDSHPLATRFGGISLGSYLPTRTVELIVHTLDLAHALGIDAEPPVDALSQALHTLVDVGIATGKGPGLALAATGRPVPDAFSVL